MKKLCVCVLCQQHKYEFNKMTDNRLLLIISLRQTYTHHNSISTMIAYSKRLHTAESIETSKQRGQTPPLQAEAGCILPGPSRTGSPPRLRLASQPKA